MTVEELAKKLHAEFVSRADGAREVRAFYAGDFLSNVMGRAEADCCWLTVMTNVNVAGVAALTDAACVVVCEGHAPDPALAERCAEQGINLLTTDLALYPACVATL